NNPAFPVLPPIRDANSIAAAFSTPDFPMVGTDFDPVILALLNFKGDQFGNSPGGFLIPTVTPSVPGGDTGALIISKPGKYSDDQFTTNWDREFRRGQDKVAARFFFSNSESVLPFGAGGLQASLGGTLSSSISATDLNFPYD